MIQKRANLRKQLDGSRAVLKARVALEKQLVAQVKHGQEQEKMANVKLDGFEATDWKSYVAKKQSDLATERKFIRASKKTIKAMEEAEKNLTAEIDRLGLDNLRLF